MPFRKLPPNLAISGPNPPSRNPLKTRKPGSIIAKPGSQFRIIPKSGPDTASVFQYPPGIPKWSKQAFLCRPDPQQPICHRPAGLPAQTWLYLAPIFPSVKPLDLQKPGAVFEKPGSQIRKTPQSGPYTGFFFQYPAEIPKSLKQAAGSSPDPQRPITRPHPKSSTGTWPFLVSLLRRQIPENQENMARFLQNMARISGNHHNRSPIRAPFSEVECWKHETREERSSSLNLAR